MRSPFAFSRPGSVEPQRLEARAVPSPKGLASELATLLSSPLPMAGLPLRVHSTPFRGGPKKQVVQLVIEILGSSVALAERGGRFESRLEIASFTVDSSGHGANGRSTTIDLRLTPDELQRVRVTGVRWMSQLELAPGRHQLRVAAREPATGAAGVVTALHCYDDVMKTVTIRDLRNRPRQVRDALRREREALLTANGSPVAVLIPVDAGSVDETLETLRRARGLEALRAIRRESRERGLDRLSASDIDAIITRARRARTAPRG